MIGTHGTEWSAGCGPFRFVMDDEDTAESYKFLRYLSQFLNKSTKVFFTGFLNLTIDKAPTKPSESAILDLIAFVIAQVIIGSKIKVKV